MEKKFLVTKLNEENKERVKLKASKLGLTIDELIISSIDAYSPDYKCYKCDNLNPIKTYEHKFSVGMDTLNVVVKNTPTLYCDSCAKEETFDLKLIAILNNIIEQEALQLFINTKERSFEFDYYEIESMNC